MSKYAKICQICNVFLAFTAGFSIRIFLEFSATLFGPVARIYSIDVFRHGLPIGVGVLCFLILQFHPKIKNWMLEVVTEVAKVVWPSKKDTFSMTFVVCIILIVSGLVLGLFDLTAGSVMKYIIN